MRPKTYTLATAGSKLTGPPEGYGRKKELQVKHWLVSASAVEDTGAPDITAEPSIYPNQSLDDVYKQLRDSTENVPAALGVSPAPCRPEGGPVINPQTAAYPAEENQATTVQTATAASVQVPCCNLDSGAAASEPSASSSSAAVPCPAVAVTAAAGPRPLTPFKCQQLRQPTHGSPEVDESAEKPDIASNVQSDSRSHPTAGSWEGKGAVSDSSQQLVQPLSTAAANLCQILAAAESTDLAEEQCANVPNPAVQALQEQLQQLTQEHQSYVSRTAAELAAAHSAAEAAKSAAAAQAAESQQTILALQHHLAAAQADAAAARSQGIQANQQAKRLLMEKEDVAAEQVEQLQQLQEQLRRVTQLMVQNSDTHQQSEKKLQQQLHEAKQQIVDSRRELEMLRSRAAVTESNLLAQLQTVKSELADMQQQHAAQVEETQELQQVCQQLRAARKAAETAEDKALQLAAERAQMFEALMLEIQKGHRHSQRHGAFSQSSKVAQQVTHKASTVEVTVHEADQDDDHHHQQQQQQLMTSAVSTSSPSNSNNRRPASAVSATAGNTTDTAGSATTSMQQKAQQTRQLQKGIAADKRALADLATAQRRARAAAQLEESSKVQQMLAAAPDALKVLCLAFRAYVVLPSASTDSSSSTSSTSSSSSSTMPWLQQLSHSYHLYLDKTTSGQDHDQADLAPSSTASSSSECPGLSAAILRVSGALLIVLPEEAAVQRLSVDRSGEAVNPKKSVHVGRVCLCLLREAVRLGIPVVFVGQGDAVHHLSFLQAAAAAGWSQQEQHALARCLSSHFVNTSDAAAQAQSDTAATTQRLQQHLGFSDLQLSLLPQTALKKLASASASQGGVVNLQCLDCTALTHITLDLATMSAAAEKQLQQHIQQASPSPGGQQLGKAAMDQVLGIVCKLAAENSTLRVMKLDNVGLAGAESIAAAVLAGRGVHITEQGSDYVCNALKGNAFMATNHRLSLIGINGLLVPVSAVPQDMSGVSAGCQVDAGGVQTELLGLTDLDLCSSSLAAQKGGRAFKAAASTQQQQQQQLAVLLTAEQAAFLAVVLPHCSRLLRLQLPLLAPDVSEEVAAKLAEAVIKLPKLLEFNGVQLDLSTAVRRDDCNKQQQAVQGQYHKAAAATSADKIGECRMHTKDEPTANAVLDLAGKQLGPVAALLVAKSLQDSSSEIASKLACSLLTLDITGCNISSYGASHVAASLAKLCSRTASQPAFSSTNSSCNGPNTAISSSAASALVALHLSGNQLGAFGLSQLLSALCSTASCSGPSILEQLQVLDISHNQLRMEGCHVLAEHIEELQGLHLLDLSGNELNAAGAQALFKAVGKKQDALLSLKVLHMGSNMIGDAGAAALAAVLPSLKQLQQLHLQENYSIGCEGVRALAAALSLTPQLAYLDLAKNNLGPQAGRVLAAGLQANAAAAAAAGIGEPFAGLRELELEWCKLKTEGVVHLASTLAITAAVRQGSSSSNDSVVRVGAASSSSSRLSNSGCSVKLHSCLQRLGLSRNGAGDKGVHALAEALATNTTLTHLDLRSNAIGLTGCRVMSGLLQNHNSSIRVLQLAGNMEGSDDHEAPILQALEELAAADRSSLKSVQCVGSRAVIHDLVAEQHA